MVLISALGLTGCDTNDVSDLGAVRLSSNSVVFDCFGGSKIIEVETYPLGVDWAVECPDLTWATIETQEGKVVVTTQANASTSTRTSAFTIYNSNALFEPIEVEILQEAAPEESFSTSAPIDDVYAIDSEGGTITFTVIASTEWDVECAAEWVAIECDKSSGRMTLTVERNETEQAKECFVSIIVGEGERTERHNFLLSQDIRANNPYYKLVGNWEITATKWFYSPNGSLNSLDYAPNPTDYYLIFAIEEGVYGQTLVMKDFLYPGTELEVRYDSQTGGFVIPFGWSVLGYDVFLYVTVVSDRQFSYASVEVDVVPTEDGTLALEMPTVAGFNHVGFGLWTYNDNGAKVAFGSSYRPTMFPMDEIVLRKQF